MTPLHFEADLGGASLTTPVYGQSSTEVAVPHIQKESVSIEIDQEKSALFHLVSMFFLSLQ